jgi:hypothetical protein
MKRNRSEGSTPSPATGAVGRTGKKPKHEGPLEVRPSTYAGETYSQALIPMKMAIVLEKFPEEKPDGET